MIQFRTLFLSVFGLFMMACAREEIIVSETSCTGHSDRDAGTKKDAFV